MIWAVVPAKFGKSAKERLAPVLAQDVRERLAKAMLSDVLRALGGCPAVEATVVISRDAAALELAAASAAEGLPEQARGGLNASVAEAIAHCTARGATGVVIAMGDLPLLRPDDVSAAVERLPERGLVLLPSSDGTGTNLVVARPPDLLEPEFGPGSLARHLEQVRRKAIVAVIHECAGAALDVDTPADLDRLRGAPNASADTVEIARLGRAEARRTAGA
ncbi:MAG: 2-phospho-L-lactate guanylyltransferase [Candidatus Binatia bacterium]|nr:2-phospho-L-lactate guanylyltransferase [Candidatus Binatia bacterium]